MSMRIISWEEYTNKNTHSLFPIPYSLSVSVGVFDGVHKGHQALIQHICGSPFLPAIVTFIQNPAKILSPAPSGKNISSIVTLDQKLKIFESLGIELTVLIDFSEKFSKIKGRSFVDSLLGCQPVGLIAIGSNFRCGNRLDTGAKEIKRIAEDRGIETWIAEPVMDKGRPVSSSRIRAALAAGRIAEAERLLGRTLYTGE